MRESTVRVGINGYGVIGKRVADAVKLQPDMTIVGVADVASDYRLASAKRRNIPLYSALEDRADEMRAAGLNVQGSLDDLLAEVDVIVDATPKGVAPPIPGSPTTAAS